MKKYPPGKKIGRRISFYKIGIHTFLKSGSVFDCLEKCESGTELIRILIVKIVDNIFFKMLQPHKKGAR